MERDLTEGEEVLFRMFGSHEGAKCLDVLGELFGEKEDAFNLESARLTDYNLGRKSVIRDLRAKLEEIHHVLSH